MGIVSYVASATFVHIETRIVSEGTSGIAFLAYASGFEFTMFAAEGATFQPRHVRMSTEPRR